MDDREAQRAPDNVNQLQITVIQCKDVMSRRKGSSAGKRCCRWQQQNSFNVTLLIYH